MDWSAVRATVLGVGVAGFAAADALLRVGARVTVVDSSGEGAVGERAQVLETLGARVVLGTTARPTDEIDLLIPSPGLPPTHPWIAGADAVSVWSGEQLAWQLRPIVDPAPWLLVTGTNGKTTTVEMLAAILRADGRHTQAVGNVGRPLVEAMFAEPSYDVLAIELSSFQLHWTHQLHADSAALLNIAVDHVDWHGSHDAYTRDKAKVFQGTTRSIVYNVDDPVTESLALQADVEQGCRAVGITLGIPEVGMLGVVDDVLVDRAFDDNRYTHATELISTAELAVSGWHNVSNALAAAALARSFGVKPQAVRQGLTTFRSGTHRLQHVAEIDDIHYIDDSKATNAHSADVALAAFDRVVWIAGGLAKGAHFDDLVERHRDRLAGVVLIGVDRASIRNAIERHAPEIPVFEVSDDETSPMDRAVQEATRMAKPGDRVLLAPACASMDQFEDYAARGDAFQSAVRRLGR